MQFNQSVRCSILPLSALPRAAEACGTACSGSACFLSPKIKALPLPAQQGFSLSKKWFAQKNCTKKAKCMPAGSGHGVSKRNLAALRRFPQAESCKNAGILARECSFFA